MTTTPTNTYPYLPPPPAFEEEVELGPRAREAVEAPLVAEPMPATIPEPGDAAQSISMSTTTPMADLLESIGVLAAGASIPLLWVSGLASAGVAAAAVAALVIARVRRGKQARANEAELVAPRYEFSAEQLAACTAALPAEATVALKALRPGVPLSRWQLTSLLAAHMGEGRAGEVFPLVVRFAGRA